MSRVRNAKGYKYEGPRLRKLRWPTRGNVPAGLVPFHHAEDPRPPQVVQGAFAAVIKLGK